MKTRIKTHNFFNLGTQRALYEKVGGYISKEFYIQEYIRILKVKHKLDRIYRFDLGQNNDGCAPQVDERVKQLSRMFNTRQYIKNYPEFICRELREKISVGHGLSSENVLLSAGLEQMISMIASAFLEINDRIMVNSPSFFLFEEYSKRMGAIPIYLHLNEEDGFRWTTKTFEEYSHILRKLNPKLVWIANPNNPTGVSIRNAMLESIVEEAANNYAFVVIDEAYGEYIDSDKKINSATEYLNEYNNLVVLRTFSKAYGLANFRIGYAMCCNPEILRALKIHRANFPITQLSYDLASVALDYSDYLKEVRESAKKRKESFAKALRDIPDISYMDSETNIFMLKHKTFTARELIETLEKSGIIVANVPGEGDVSRKFIRVTVGSEEEMDYFINVLKKIKT